MPLLFESGRMNSMPKKIDPALRERAVRLVLKGAKLIGTNSDLTGWGPRLMMALVAMIITGFVGMLFGFGFGGSVLYCGIGLVVFMLLTAYDTQKLQQMYSYYSADAEMAEKASIYGALTLYLDFINIFLYVVRLMGNNRRRS